MGALPVSSHLLILTMCYGKYNCSVTKVLKNASKNFKKTASAFGIKVDKISVVSTELLIFQTFSAAALPKPDLVWVTSVDPQNCTFLHNKSNHAASNSFGELFWLAGL